MQVNAVEQVPYVGRLEEVPGSLERLDAELMVHLSEAQHSRSVRGDLFEVGTWFGRTSILLAFSPERASSYRSATSSSVAPPTEEHAKNWSKAGGDRHACRLRGELRPVPLDHARGPPVPVERTLRDDARTAFPLGPCRR